MLKYGVPVRCRAQTSCARFLGCDSSAAGACRFFHNSVPPSKQNRLGNPPRSWRALGLPTH